MDRGSLPFALIHSESLVACAAWAAGQAGVFLADASVTWEALVEASESGDPLVLHDALCPMTPPEFIASCVEVAAATGVVVVGVRPVTDSVKVVRDHVVTGAVHREDLLSICSPVVLPAHVVAAMDGLPSTDLVELVSWLAQRFEVLPTTAPASARRVMSIDDVAVLQAQTAP